MIIEVTTVAVDKEGVVHHDEITIGVFTIAAVFTPTYPDDFPQEEKVGGVLLLSGISSNEGVVGPQRFHVKETREEINEKIKQAAIDNATEAGRSMMQFMNGTTWTDRKKKKKPDHLSVVDGKAVTK